jgi:hypothetical protein
MNPLAPVIGTRGPAFVAASGPRASCRFLEFFTAQIRNPHTRRAYARAATEFFGWLEAHGVTQLTATESVHVATYIEELQRARSAPTVKLRLAALRHLFDWMVIGQIMPTNPTAAVRGPRHVVRRGKTPVLDPAEARQLLDAIDTSTVIGLRDRALIGLMVYSFARIGAAIAGPIFVRGQALKREAVAQIVEHEFLEFLGEKRPGVADGQRRLFEDQLSQFPGSRKHLVGGQHLVYHAQSERLSRWQTLAGQEEVGAAVPSEEIRPEDLHTVPRDETVGEVRRVSEEGVICGNDDVTEHGNLRVNVNRPIYRRDDRNLDVEKVHNQPLRVAVGMIPAGRRNLRPGEPPRRESVGIHHLDESVANPGHNDDSVLAVSADVVKGLTQLPVGPPAPGHGFPIIVKGNFEEAFVALHSNVRVFSSIILKATPA